MYIPSHCFQWNRWNVAGWAFTELFQHQHISHNTENWASEWTVRRLGHMNTYLKDFFLCLILCTSHPVEGKEMLILNILIGIWQSREVNLSLHHVNRANTVWPWALPWSQLVLHSHHCLHHGQQSFSLIVFCKIRGLICPELFSN